MLRLDIPSPKKKLLQNSKILQKVCEIHLHVMEDVRCGRAVSCFRTGRHELGNNTYDVHDSCTVICFPLHMLCVGFVENQPLLLTLIPCFPYLTFIGQFLRQIRAIYNMKI